MIAVCSDCRVHSLHSAVSAGRCAAGTVLVVLWVRAQQAGAVAGERNGYRVMTERRGLGGGGYRVGRLGRVRRGGAPPPGSGCQLANLPTFRFVGFSAFRLVGKSESWRIGGVVLGRVQGRCRRGDQGGERARNGRWAGVIAECSDCIMQSLQSAITSTSERGVRVRLVGGALLGLVYRRIRREEAAGTG